MRISRDMENDKIQFRAALKQSHDDNANLMEKLKMLESKGKFCCLKVILKKPFSFPTSFLCLPFPVHPFPSLFLFYGFSCTFICVSRFLLSRLVGLSVVGEKTWGILGSILHFPRFRSNSGWMPNEFEMSESELKPYSLAISADSGVYF